MESNRGNPKVESATETGERIEYVPFNILVFETKHTMKSPDYFKALTHRAIVAHLISPEEASDFSKKFSTIELPFAKIIQVWENIIAHRFKTLDEKNYVSQMDAFHNNLQ